MGGVVSKAGRALPKGSPNVLARNTPFERQPLRASERKDEFIEADSKDPQLLGNLNRLGPVRVDRSIQNSLSSNVVSATLRAREQSEAEATLTSTIRNRLLASSLIEVLDERKNGQIDLDGLAAKYPNLDRDVLEKLTRSVNSPSLDQASARKIIDEDGAERFLIQAKWV